MDTEVTSSTESEVTTPSSTETSSETLSSSPESNDSTIKDGEPTAPSVPVYKPDYKLKVYDEEKELDDPFLKALIKDADSEKKVKEIAQKYLGFDTVKGRHEKIKQEYQTYQQQTQPVMQYYSKAAGLLEKGDLDGFFGLLKIPTQKVFEYAVQKAEEAQLPQEQQMQLQRQRQDQLDRENLANQNQSLMSQQQQQLVQFRAQELGWVLQRPDVSSVQQAFDAKNGPGAFRQLVIDKGLAHYAATQGREDLSAEQAAMAVVKMIGAVIQPMTVNGLQAPNQNQLIPQNENPPIIPNVTGRGSSPVKKQVRSIADIKKKREELMSSS